MGSSGKVLLLACGSFNPPTYMHLRMFELARDYLRGEGVEVVGGVISPVHDAYGKKDLAPAKHRLSMLELALQSSDWIRLSRWETQQEGWSRTRRVLQYHQSVINKAGRGQVCDESWLPEQKSLDQTDNISNMHRDIYNNNCDGVEGRDERRDVRVKLLCGADLLESFATPGLWADEDLHQILSEHGLVVISRAGSDPENFIHESDVLYTHRRHVTLVRNWLGDSVSSTALRRLLRRGLSIKYLTDDNVASYASQHKLYPPHV